jgi:hypothetical protein
MMNWRRNILGKDSIVNRLVDERLLTLRNFQRLMATEHRSLCGLRMGRKQDDIDAERMI